MLKIVTTHPIQYQVPIWRELARRGRVPFEVMFLCDHGYRSSYDEEFGAAFNWDVGMLDGYESRFVKKGRSPAGFWSLRLTLSLWFELLRRQPSAIWIQGWQVAGYWEAALLARFSNASLWLRGETNARSGSGKLRIARKAALSMLFSRVARFLCIGEANRAFYLAHGVAASRLASAPYCVDNDFFRHSAARHRASRDAIRAEWGVPKDAFCFLFVGKFIEKKRPLDIVAAAETLREKTRETHVIWVGSGALELTLRERARNCADRGGAGSSFVGFLNQSEIARAYGVADCLVLPSGPDETWGLVVNEAMASGLPVIISDACGCAEDLSLPGREDLIYPCGDVEALAASMSAVIENPPRDEEIARKIADYDFRKTVDTIEALYERVSAQDGR